MLKKCHTLSWVYIFPCCSHSSLWVFILSPISNHMILVWDSVIIWISMNTLSKSVCLLNISNIYPSCWHPTVCPTAQLIRPQLLIHMPPDSWLPSLMYFTFPFRESNLPALILTSERPLSLLFLWYRMRCIYRTCAISSSSTKLELNGRKFLLFLAWPITSISVFQMFAPHNLWNIPFYPQTACSVVDPCVFLSFIKFPNSQVCSHQYMYWVTVATVYWTLFNCSNRIVGSHSNQLTLTSSFDITELKNPSRWVSHLGKRTWLLKIASWNSRRKCKQNLSN